MKLNNPHERAETLEHSLSAELNDQRFIPYLQVHEFEALVLSNPDVFADWFEGKRKEAEALAAECRAFETPEMIDHGRETHPKARIVKHIEVYDENVDGPLLAHEIGLATIRERCPHFNQWLTRLEQLDVHSNE